MLVVEEPLLQLGRREGLRLLLCAERGVLQQSDQGRIGMHRDLELLLQGHAVRPEWLRNVHVLLNWLRDVHVRAALLVEAEVLQRPGVEDVFLGRHLEAERLGAGDLQRSLEVLIVREAHVVVTVILVGDLETFSVVETRGERSFQRSEGGVGGESSDLSFIVRHFDIDACCW